jgi:hypothetical protein
MEQRAKAPFKFYLFENSRIELRLARSSAA